jgi:phosphoserine aminotransferase
VTRVYNFTAGPAALPLSVLERVQQELLDYQAKGMSILEMSHRSKQYDEINASAEERFKRLLDIGEGYRVLFMQGGASTQFALLPMNFLREGGAADYVLTGVWSEKALEEAQRLGDARVAASTRDEQYRRIPATGELHLSDSAAYVHLTSNNTIYGTQWHEFPRVGERRLVADMSSDILSRPFPAERFSLIYAGAQKNLGPAGVTVVLLQEEWLASASESLPTMFRYRTYAKSNSLYNTPPVFAVYVLNLVLEWIEESGGLEAIAARNRQKATLLYDAIDRSGGFYRGHAEYNSRSLMNVTFNLPAEALEKQFVSAAAEQHMVGLAGHRSVGGVRASLYNATSLEACEALASFMEQFAAREG